MSRHVDGYGSRRRRGARASEPTCAPRASSCTGGHGPITSRTYRWATRTGTGCGCRSARASTSSPAERPAPARRRRCAASSPPGPWRRGQRCSSSTRRATRRTSSRW